MSTIIKVDGKSYMLTITPISEPTFKLLDIVSYIGSDTADTITSVTNDRYYLDFSDHYILIQDQGHYKKIGEATLSPTYYD